MAFTDELRKATEKSWEMSLKHPFVMGIVNGDLPLDTFKYYLLQDIYYLKHYAKVHALAAAQTDDFHHTSMLAEKARRTAQAELTVHEAHAEQLNITEEDMKNFRPAPTAYGYTSHLYRAALSGSFAQTIAALLPCYWLYADIGKTYENANPKEQIYQNWLDMYSGEFFQTSTQEMVDLLNEYAEGATEEEKEKITEQFVLAKEYELAFWEMSYTKEGWLSEKVEAGV